MDEGARNRALSFSLEKLKVYLAGAVLGLDGEQYAFWREPAIDLLQASRFTPVDGLPRTLVERVSSSRAVVNRAKAQIDACDLVLLSAQNVSWSGSMELLYAAERGKPVVAFGAQAPICDWLVDHVVALVPTMTDAVERLESIREFLSSEKILSSMETE